MEGTPCTCDGRRICILTWNWLSTIWWCLTASLCINFILVNNFITIVLTNNIWILFVNVIFIVIITIIVVTSMVTNFLLRLVNHISFYSTCHFHSFSSDFCINQYDNQDCVYNFYEWIYFFWCVFVCVLTIYFITVFSYKMKKMKCNTRK